MLAILVLRLICACIPRRAGFGLLIAHWDQPSNLECWSNCALLCVQVDAEQACCICAQNLTSAAGLGICSAI